MYASVWVLRVKIRQPHYTGERRPMDSNGAFGHYKRLHQDTAPARCITMAGQAVFGFLLKNLS